MRGRLLIIRANVRCYNTGMVNDGSCHVIVYGADCHTCKTSHKTLSLLCFSCGTLPLMRHRRHVFYLLSPKAIIKGINTNISGRPWIVAASHLRERETEGRVREVGRDRNDICFYKCLRMLHYYDTNNINNNNILSPICVAVLKVTTKVIIPPSAMFQTLKEKTHRHTQMILT